MENYPKGSEIMSNSQKIFKKIYWEYVDGRGFGYIDKKLLYVMHKDPFDEGYVLIPCEPYLGTAVTGSKDFLEKKAQTKMEEFAMQFIDFTRCKRCKKKFICKFRENNNCKITGHTCLPEAECSLQKKGINGTITILIDRWKDKRKEALQTLRDSEEILEFLEIIEKRGLR